MRPLNAKDRPFPKRREKYGGQVNEVNLISNKSTTAILYHLIGEYANFSHCIQNHNRTPDWV